MSDPYQDTFNALRAMGLPPDKCARGADQAHPERAAVVASLVTAETLAADEARREKTIELHADRQLQAIGFDVVKFSHPERTKQTPGIPDRKYYSVRHALTFWWEAKTPTGRQSSVQRDFQVRAEACGEYYVLGTDRVLFAWLVARGVAMWDGEQLVSSVWHSPAITTSIIHATTSPDVFAP